MTPQFQLRGVLAPLTTPFAADGSLALDHLAANIGKYNRIPLSGYVITGSTGESVMLTREETERVWAAAREAAAPGKILLAGTGVDSTAETIARTRRAADLGYTAALVKTPYYYKPMMTPAALEAHFRCVADASPIPIVIYSIPVFAGITVEADLAARLSEHPNIAGIKDSSGSPERAGQIVRQSRPGFQTVVGSAQMFAASLAAGAQGGVLGLACVLPELCVELFDAHRRGETARVEDLQRTIAEPARTIVAKYGPPGVKYAMEGRGYYGGPPRSPFLPLTAGEASEIDAVLAALPAVALK
ncbi:MAG TPA: dihydrodipicolinate synthase family protein [Candidatus Acidoferrales bacterium]|nr:dihydrodipicolinate synthase family protein [Candidatus Acidoferrales bacterium]